MRIVRYTEARRQEWFDILKEADSSFYNPERAEQETWTIDSLKNDLIGYDHEDMLIAVAARNKYSSLGSQIYKSYVRPPYRRKGIGTMLTALCESDMRGEGARWIWTQVDASNFANLKLKLRMGYHVVKVERIDCGHQWVQLCKEL